MPTYVTDKSLTLCKVASRVENTYEARLVLYFAVESNREFILRVVPGAQVAPDLRSKVEEHGGRVEEAGIKDYSVFIGRQSPNTSDAGGWVLGDNQAWELFRSSLPVSALRDRLIPGASFAGADLVELEIVILGTSISQTNVDGENIREALLDLIAGAKADGGRIYVQ